MTTFKSHNYNYQYETKQKACYYCRFPFAKISRHKIQYWEDHRVCDSCFLQLKHGTVLVRGQNLIRSTQALGPKICKMCQVNKIYPITFDGHPTNRYPHFCQPCRIKFEQMVKDNPKQP